MNREYTLSLYCSDLFGHTLDTQFVFTATGTADLTPPGKPENIQARADSAGNIVITWDSVSDPDLDGYILFRKTSADGVLSVLSSKINETRFYDQFPPDADELYYGAAAFDIWGNTSDTVFTFSPVTGLSETAEKNQFDFHVYPNPAGDEIFLKGKFNQPGTVEIQVYNLLGVSVYSGSYSSGTVLSAVLNSSRWPAGFYFIQVRQNKKNLGVYKILVIQ